MAIKERDVVLMGKDGTDQTIDMPITRLGNIEDGAEVKTALADADAVPVVDSVDGAEMKKITWANVIAAIKGKLNSVYAAASHTHAWSAITGKPASMTPTAHKDTHKTGGADALTAADVGADPAGSAAAVDTKLTAHTGSKTNPHGVTAAQVGARPSSWTPSKADVGLGSVPNVATNDQTPTFSQAATRANLVSGEKLSVLVGKIMKWFADLKAVAFSGSAADLNTGTLSTDRLPTVPLTKGGTGATTAATARTALGAAAKVAPVTVTVSTAWTGSGPWTKTVTVSGVTASDTNLGVYPVDIADAAARKLYEEAYGCLSAEAETVAGGIKLTCRDKKPTINFQIKVQGVR